MHDSFDKSGENGTSVYQKWGIGFLALPVLLVTALFALSILQPVTSNWIAEAVQAEFAGFNAMPDGASAQLARPATEIRTVRAN